MAVNVLFVGCKYTAWPKVCGQLHLTSPSITVCCFSLQAVVSVLVQSHFTLNQITLAGIGEGKSMGTVIVFRYPGAKRIRGRLTGFDTWHIMVSSTNTQPEYLCLFKSKMSRSINILSVKVKSSDEVS